MRPCSTNQRSWASRHGKTKTRNIATSTRCAVSCMCRYCFKVPASNTGGRKATVMQMIGLNECHSHWLLCSCSNPNPGTGCVWIWSQAFVSLFCFHLITWKSNTEKIARVGKLVLQTSRSRKSSLPHTWCQSTQSCSRNHTGHTHNTHAFARCTHTHTPLTLDSCRAFTLTHTEQQLKTNKRSKA